MSSDTIARVLAFYRKATELKGIGHLLRAADYYSRAVEAARALGPDNLVVVDMQRCRASMLLNYAAAVANTNAVVDPLIVTAYRADCVALLYAAVAALERRRVAGTLLEGKCTAAEEAWYAETKTCKTAWPAPLTGYNGFLRVANSVLCLLSNASCYAVVCSAPQFQAFAEFTVQAADLMQQPRSHSTLCMGAEVDLTTTFTSVVALDLAARGLDARMAQLVTNAWLRLQRSGVLETRGTLEEIRRRKHITTSDHDKYDAACCSHRDGRARPAQLRFGWLRRQGGAPAALQTLFGLSSCGLLQQGAPAGGLAGAQSRLQSRAQGEGRSFGRRRRPRRRIVSAIWLRPQKPAAAGSCCARTRSVARRKMKTTKARWPSCEPLARHPRGSSFAAATDGCTHVPCKAPKQASSRRWPRRRNAGRAWSPSRAPRTAPGTAAPRPRRSRPASASLLRALACVATRRPARLCARVRLAATRLPRAAFVRSS